MLKELQLLFEEDDLLHQPETVLIVAANLAYNMYKDHSIYVCQPNRSFRKTKHMGFYYDGYVQKEFPAILEVFDEISCEQFLDKDIDDDIKERVKAYYKSLGDEETELRKIMVLSGPDDNKTIKRNNTIENNLTSKNGRKTAFTQGQRYVLLEKIENDDLKFTKDIL